MSTPSTAPFDLTSARVNAGFSIRALSAKLDVPAATITRLENGLGASPARAKVVADFFGVRVTDLPAFQVGEGATR